MADSKPSTIHLVPSPSPKPQHSADPKDIAAEVLEVVRECKGFLVLLSSRDRSAPRSDGRPSGRAGSGCCARHQAETLGGSHVAS